MNKHKTNPLVTAIGSAFVAATALSAVALSSTPLLRKTLSRPINCALATILLKAMPKENVAKVNAEKARPRLTLKANVVKVSAAKARQKAETEGKCGEGKCGAEKADSEGSCGGDKAKAKVAAAEQLNALVPRVIGLFERYH